jgi:hypothetical protein
MNRELWQIAEEIKKDWIRVSPYASPYLEAMYSLRTINDKYGYDSAKSIVLYFLCNARAWRGDTAKRVKTELKSIAGVK